MTLPLGIWKLALPRRHRQTSWKEQINNAAGGAHTALANDMTVGDVVAASAELSQRTVSGTNGRHSLTVATTYGLLLRQRIDSLPR